MEVPIATSLSSIYPADALEAQTKRWNSLIQAFRDKYGKAPDFISRSPGRVNIIGEHIDYSLYSVLPMAVTADVLLAVSTTTPAEHAASHVRLANVHAHKFAAREFDIPPDGAVHIDSTTLEWTNYFKSGLVGATRLLQHKNAHFPKSVGMDVLADGSVPTGGGLSSSAAFVCASALAVLRANSVSHIDKKELTELAIESERAVGVNSGGMDQAASVFPLQGSALYVSFVPELSAQNISFPTLSSPMTFVIAQTFVAADKHTTAPECYNLRVVEVTLAALVLARIFRLTALPPDAAPLGVSLRGFHDTYMREREHVTDNHAVTPTDLDAQLQDLIGKVDQYLPQEDGYTRQQLSDLLGLDIPTLEARYMTKFPIRAERFLLRQRALHVFAEARRVLQFRALLASAADSPPPTPAATTALLQQFGALLNDTQDSCREIYQNSCPELDQLCRLARDAGAYGSRLTGAGWGGCSVHLVPEDRVEAVRERWIREYYRPRFPDMDEQRLAEAIVVSKPGSGSCLVDVDEGRTF